MFVQLTGLGEDEMHVAELVGVEPGTLSRKATGTAEKMVSPLLVACTPVCKFLVHFLPHIF